MAYDVAWNATEDAGDPLWLQWLWRLVIFALPIAILCTSVIYGIHRSEWTMSIATIVSVLILHPLITVFIYHTFYETIFESDDELS